MWILFKIFFTLGCISFGGPAAHIGYFRTTFVQRLSWLTEKEYTEFVALSQLLPGPGSSQVGFAIGYHKLGLKGAILAFLGFTLPSVILMLLVVLSTGYFSDNSFFESVIHGLKLLAVVVVFDAVLSMYKNFCKQKISMFLCLLTASVLLISPSVLSQLMVLISAAIVGFFLLTPKQPKKGNDSTSVSCSISYIPLILFLTLLFCVPVFYELSPFIQLFSNFFQAGSLVFGGGHVVLPLLENIVGGQVSSEQFLTGYAIAQAVPGPMFTFATYIGYLLLPSSPIIGALVATIAVFLPGFLLLLICLKNWKSLSEIPKLTGALDGVNAAVVGLLVSALYQPVFTSAVFNGLDMAMVLIGIYLLKVQKIRIVSLVGVFIMLGILLNLNNFY